MAYKKRKLEDLNVLDDFMFSAAASDEEVGKEFCRTVLSVLLQKELGEIQITAQKTILPCTPEMRGIRMDVEVKEPLEDTLPSLNVYDVEPHLRKEKYFPRHNRFYQAKIDSRYIRSGERDFGNLPNLFVLTITEYDPFGKDQMIYTVSNSCREEPGLKYDDGLVFYYFNTKGKKGGTPEIRAMLKYMMESTEKNVVNKDIRNLHRCVERVKVLPEIREEFMRFEDVIAWEKEKSHEEGIEEGRKEGRIRMLIEISRESGLSDEKILKQLMDKCELTEKEAREYLMEC
ncbi:hypothetical protein JCM17039_09530 [Blautia glucerasea]